jgi:hypothetical protein
MKPTSALLIAIAAFVVNPCTGSLALAQFTQATTPAAGPARSQSQDNVLAYNGGANRSGKFTVPGLAAPRPRARCRGHSPRFAVIFTSMTQTLSITSVLDGYAINIAEF